MELGQLGLELAVRLRVRRHLFQRDGKGAQNTCCAPTPCTFGHCGLQAILLREAADRAGALRRRKVGRELELRLKLEQVPLQRALDARIDERTFGPSDRGADVLSM